jgi:MFS family permease
MRNSKSYENRLVAILFLTWGTVFLDRMSLAYLAPFIAPDLHLNEAQIGLLVSALAVAWAVASLVFGAISDRIGRRPVLIPSIFAFSALSWLSGVVHSFGQLFFVRSLMGVAEGPAWPTITATIEASSSPERRGRNVGIVVSAAGLVGLALAPVLTTQVAAHFGWRAAFFIAGVPGIILGFVIWKFVREPNTNGAVESGVAAPHHHKPTWGDYFSLLRYRNIWLCCVGAAGFMTWLFVMNVFAPLYITEVSKNSATTAGFVIGASGFGSFLWGWIFPWFSDRIGRKPALLIMALLSAVVPLTYQASFLAGHPWLMAGAGFIANGGQGIAALIIVLVPSESVPAGLAATAIGFATLVGEIVGGAFAPAIAGAIATRHGLAAPLWIAAGGAMVVFFASMFLRETAPAKVRKPEPVLA